VRGERGLMVRGGDVISNGWERKLKTGEEG
jgi:hypothetical protein